MSEDLPERWQWGMEFGRDAVEGDRVLQVCKAISLHVARYDLTEPLEQRFLVKLIGWIREATEEPAVHYSHGLRVVIWISETGWRYYVVIEGDRP